MSVPQPGDEIIATASQCTDHMITVVWKSTTGWEDPELRPYGNLSLAPTASVLHYATECFEGMKMYRGYDGKLRLFRPDANCRRMLMSSTRIALPGFDPKELEKLIIAMISVDGPKWLPNPGTFLYLRPTMIGSGAVCSYSCYFPWLGCPKGLRHLKFSSPQFPTNDRTFIVSFGARSCKSWDILQPSHL
jgi:branched-chain amino acid aminotransferase